jgi:spermidine synthase
MGFAHPLHAVDLSLTGERVFRGHAGAWAGDVVVVQDDAARWLRRNRASWDLILEDLSEGTALGVTKPSVSLGELPALMKKRLKPSGIAITNVLPVPGMTWGTLLKTLARPWAHRLVVHLEEYENRILVASRQPLDARATSTTLRRHLSALGSDQHDRLWVRKRLVP